MLHIKVVKRVYHRRVLIQGKNFVSFNIPYTYAMLHAYIYMHHIYIYIKCWMFNNLTAVIKKEEKA